MDDAVTTEMPRIEDKPNEPAAHPTAAGPDAFAEKPEVFVGVAFAGGLVLAKLVKRLGR